MAIKLSIATGVTGSGSTKWYALYFQRSTGKIADTTNSTWDTIVAGDLADYSSFLSEVSTSGVYEATVPAFVETAALTEPVDYLILATAAGTEAWTDGAVGKPRYEGTLGAENANLTAMVSVAQSATDLKDFADDGYDPSTNKVQGVVITDSLTTNNDKTGYRLSATGVDDIWDEAQSGHATAGTFGLYLDVAVSSRLATAGYTTPPTVGAIADQVWDEATSGHTTSGTFGEQVKTDIDAILDDTGTSGVIVVTNNDKTGYRLSATGVDDVWDEATSGHASAGTFGKAVADILDDTGTSGVIVVTNNDKTGYRLSATGVDDIWDEAQSGHATAGTFGLYLDVAVSSRLATSGYTVPPTVGAIADQVWDEATSGHTTSGTFGEQLKTDVDAILDDTGTSGVIVVTNNDKTGYRLSATGIDDVWDEAQSGHATAGTFGLYLDATVSSRLASAGYTTPPTVGAIADQVWDEATSGHTTSGTFGEQLKTDVDAILDDTGTAGVVVDSHTTAAKAELQQEATDALNAYDPPTRAEATSDANSIIAYVDLIDDGTSGLAKIATDVAAILVDTGTTLDAFIQAIKAKTDNLPASPAAVGSAMTLTSAYDVYHADIKLNVDDANTQDEYTITWFKNGVRVTSGITSPTIQVVKRADGTDLISSTTPTQIASTGSYKHDATGSSRMTAGQDALAIVGATIDGSARTFATLVGRDSSA